MPLWDHQPLLDTFAQIQEIRTYYDFVSVDNDRYMIDGEYRQIMLSARELNSDSLPNRNWINERLTFTHGYGLTLGPVNQVTPRRPAGAVHQGPAAGVDGRPAGRRAEHLLRRAVERLRVRARRRPQEFHYPKGDDNVYDDVRGQGRRAASAAFFRRLLFAHPLPIDRRSLLSDDLTDDSRVLFHRRIAERVDAIAPFLHYDADPYLAIVERPPVLDAGRLHDQPTVSVFDASAPDGVNYIRNSVKVDDRRLPRHDDVLPASTRRIRSPRRSAAVFPGAASSRSARCRRTCARACAIRRGIFALQAAMFATYHMTNPAVFYNKEDQWEVPAIDAERRAAARCSRTTRSCGCPARRSAEFIQMLPFTPRQKDNLAAWMVARSDGEHYGQLIVFQFPKQKVVFGPRQVVARINQDQVISPQITLWNQQGSEVIQGTLLVIPIEESLLYVRPLYLRAAGGRIPELKRVIVALPEPDRDGAETLDAALDRIFPRTGARPSDLTSASPAGPAPGAGGATGAAPSKRAPPRPPPAPRPPARSHRRAPPPARRPTTIRP